MPCVARGRTPDGDAGRRRLLGRHRSGSSCRSPPTPGKRSADRPPRCSSPSPTATPIPSPGAWRHGSSTRPRVLAPSRSLPPCWSACRTWRGSTTPSRRSSPTPPCCPTTNQLRRVSKRHKDLTPVVEAYRRYRALRGRPRRGPRAAGRGQWRRAGAGPRRGATPPRTELAELEEQLKVLLIPADPNDGKNVIVEIRGAEGGEEANLFARDLFEMYQAYAARMGWPVEVLSIDPSDLGGLNQVTFIVKGDSAWTHLKFEGGPHRVQRVPVTESSGPHPHVVGDGAGAAGGRGGRRRDRPQRPPDRRLPLVRPGRAGGQHHRLRRADHAQADAASPSPCRTSAASSRTGPGP